MRWGLRPHHPGSSHLRNASARLVLDVSNPANPTLRGGLELKGGVVAAALLDPKTILTANMPA